jgi:glycerate dehydrogenase
MRIVCLDGYTLNPGDNPWDAIAGLGDLQVYDRTPAELILSRAEGAEIVLTNKTPLTAETLAALPKLKHICELATGYDGVKVQKAKELGITVSNFTT